MSPINNTRLGSDTPALFIANSPKALPGLPNVTGVRLVSSATKSVNAPVAKMYNRKL